MMRAFAYALAVIYGAIALWLVIAYYADRRSATERRESVDAAAAHRAQEDWNARVRRAEWARNYRASRNARAKLQRLQHRKGGTPAA